MEEQQALAVEDVAAIRSIPQRCRRTAHATAVLAALHAFAGEASLLLVHFVNVLLCKELSWHQGLLLPVLRQWPFDSSKIGQYCRAVGVRLSGHT